MTDTSSKNISVNDTKDTIESLINLLKGRTQLKVVNSTRTDDVSISDCFVNDNAIDSPCPIWMEIVASLLKNQLDEPFENKIPTWYLKKFISNPVPILYENAISKNKFKTHRECTNNTRPVSENGIKFVKPICSGGGGNGDNVKIFDDNDDDMYL